MKSTENSIEKNWMQNVIKEEEIKKYLNNGKDFINDSLILEKLNSNKNPDSSRILEIIDKSLGLERLTPDETAALINLDFKEEELWSKIFEAAKKIKEKVYGRRIVTFAPLYISNYCVNNCEYCGYRKSNSEIIRKQLTKKELQNEIISLVNEGHKRLIISFGEHPKSDAKYIADVLEIIYNTKTEKGEIRRANVNASPFSISDLKLLKDVGIGTYQVFQETYNHSLYSKVHTEGLKANYQWRLYALHRSLEAGADDVGIGALFGLADWKFEIMGLLYHTIDLEDKFGGVGPHTISFPRLEPAVATPFNDNWSFKVNDECFKKIVAILRLAVPYTGLILTCRETPEIRNEVLELGVTQLDFGSNIGIGEYSTHGRNTAKQQFLLNDNRSLDEGVRWLASKGHIVSFCTAGYRCGRTGHYFMDIAKQGKVHSLCMPNAILTYREYLNDYASEETKKIGEKLIEKELAAIENSELKNIVSEFLIKIENGERDLYV